MNFCLRHSEMKNQETTLINMNRIGMIIDQLATQILEPNLIFNLQIGCALNKRQNNWVREKRNIPPYL